MLSAIGLFLTLLTGRETMLYFLILSLILFMNALYIILGKPSGFMLGSFILWHLMMYLDKVPAIDIGVGEGSEMVREMRLNDHWQFQWAHNPSYNPLPTIAFLEGTLSRITTMNWYSYSLVQIAFLAILIVYDLAIYILTYTITKDSKAALMSISLVAITPETPIHQHPYQWSGNALVLIATSLLINIIKGERSNINFITIILLFTGAIFAHATGLSYIFLLLVLLFIRAVPKHLLHKRELLVLFDTRWLIRILSVLLIILVVRSVYTYGYLGYTYPALEGIFRGLVNLIREFFAPSEETSRAIHIPLYERAGITWIQTYVWSYALSIATAYMLYSLIESKTNLLEFTLYTTCALFISITFIGYGLLKSKEFYWLNRTVVFIPLVYPLAAKALIRLFRGLIHITAELYSIIALLGLLLFVATAPIAAQDPNISPIQYARARNSDPISLSPSDMLKAEAIIGHLYGAIKLDLVASRLYRTGTYKWVGNATVVGVWLPSYTCKLEAAIGLFSFINKANSPITAVLTPDKANRNLPLIFNTGDERVYLHKD
jgi:hypothetical protein